MTREVGAYLDDESQRAEGEGAGFSVLVNARHRPSRAGTEPRSPHVLAAGA